MATTIYFGNKQIIGILEDKGIMKGKILTHIEGAILSYRNLITREIIDGIKDNPKELWQNVNQALLAAVNNNNIEGGQFAIEKGAKINAHYFYRKKKTPLHIAVESRSKEMIEILISKGANINEIDFSISEFKDIYYKLL